VAPPLANPTEAAAVDAAIAGLSPLTQAEVAIRWVVERFGNQQVILASSMGDEVLVHLASQVAPGIRVLFLDTGYHFAETIGTRDAFAATRPLELITVTPRQTVAEQDAQYGPELFAREPDLCCALRKVEPLERGLRGHVAWLTGRRRVDAATRTEIPVVGWDRKRGMIQVNPIASWDDAAVAEYAESNGVLLNPLRDIGYTSIGCQPCTRPTAPGEDPRAGRWAGHAKTECGLHT
jgi:phosphoadenosine phosphosulfate reductase